MSMNVPAEKKPDDQEFTSSSAGPSQPIYPDSLSGNQAPKTKIQPVLIQRIMHHILESARPVLKQIKASKITSPPDSLAACYQILLKTEALFDAVSREGEFYEEDLEQIADLRRMIASQRELSEQKGEEPVRQEGMSSHQQDPAYLLDIAAAALDELGGLNETMEVTYDLEQTFLRLLVRIESGTFSPEFPGESLLLPAHFIEGCEVLQHLSAFRFGSAQGTLARQSAEEMVSHGVKSLAFALSEWVDHAVEAIRRQRELLLAGYQSGDEASRAISAAMLFSLQNQLNANCTAFIKGRQLCSSSPDFEEIVNALDRSFEKIKTELSALQASVSNASITKAESIPVYGSEEWQQHAMSRFPLPPAEKDEAGWALFHPERWGDATKQLIRWAFFGLQLSQKAIEESHHLSSRGGSFAKAEGSGTVVAGWVGDAVERITGVVGGIFSPAGATHQTLEGEQPTTGAEEEKAEFYRTQRNSAEYKYAGDRIAAAKIELEKGIAKAKEERHTDHLALLHKAQRDLELIVRERPALGAAHETAARWRENVEMRCDRAAELLSKIKGSASQVQKTTKPLTKSEEHTLKVLQNYIESPSLLPPRQDVEQNNQLPDKLFQHLLGDFFGKETRLEGYSSRKMLNYVLGMVSAKVDSLRNHPLCNDGDREEYCSSLFDVEKADLPLDTFLKLEQQMKQAAEFQEKFERVKGAQFVEDFKEKIDSLRPGESFFFMGGWQKKSEGHAIVYEIVKEANGLFTFRVFNRGQGAEYHASAVIEGRQQMMSFMEIVDIPREGITNPIFSLGIQEINQKPQEYQDDWGPKDFYEKLLPLLKGKNSRRLYTKDMMMRHLQVGHCSYLSLTALMNYHLGDRRASTKWEVEMQFKTLWDYYSQTRTVLPMEEQPRRLLREGFVQFSRNLADARGSHALSDAEVAWIGNKLKIVEIDLIDAETKAQILAIEASPVVSIQPVHVPLNGISDYLYVNSPRPIDEAYVPPLTQFVDRSDWEYRPERLILDLESLLAETKELGPLQISSAKVAIETILSRIPIKGQVFWQGITPEEATRSLGVLGDLSRTYFKISSLNKFKLNEADKLFPEEYLAAIKILTLADALAADFKDVWGFGFPNLYQGMMDSMLESGSIASSMTDPVWEEERRQLRDYWRQVSPPDTRYSTPSLTGFEHGYDKENDEGKFRRFHRYSDTLQKDKFNDEKVVWGDVAFALNWLKQPEVVKKLPYFDFANKGDLHQALLLLTKDYRHVDYALPAEFFHLRDISRVVFYSHCKIRKQFYENLADPKSVLRPAEGWKEIGDRINLLFEEETLKETGDSLEIWNPNNQWIERLYVTINKRLLHEPLEQMEKTHGSSLHSPLLESLVPFAKEATVSGVLNMGPHLVVRHRISPHERLVIVHERPEDGNVKLNPIELNLPQHIAVDLPYFETQEFLALSSVNTLQIQETLAFFKANAHLLLQRHYQEMFRYLMTENGLFIDELLKDPELSVEFTSSLASFCSDQYYASKERGVIGDMLYFLELNQQFADLLNFTLNKNPDAFPNGFLPPFSNLIDECRELAMRPSLSPVDRGIAHLILMESALAGERLSDSSIKDLLVGSLHFDIYGLPVNEDTVGVVKGRFIKAGAPELGVISKPKDQRWDPAKTRRMEEILVKARTRLAAALPDPVSRDTLFNEALAVYLPHFTPRAWKTAPAFPHFQSTDGRYTLDLEQGSLFDRAGALRVFPRKERELPFVKSVLGDEPNVLARRSKDGTLAFQDRFGNEYLLQQGIYLYRNFDGRWYKAFNPGEFYKRVPEGLILDSIFWVGQAKGSAPISGGFFQSLGATLRLRDLPFDHLEAFIEDRVSNRLKYRLELDCTDAADKQYVVRVVHRLDGEQKETGEVLAEITNSSYVFFNRIETLDHVLVWQNLPQGPSFQPVPAFSRDPQSA